MPAQFESVNSPIVREPIVSNGVSSYCIDDDIVISGVSGRLPESSNIDEFKKQLFDGVDLVTADDRRWIPGLYGMPERCGKLKDISLFDANYFGVHAKQADLMDPQLRMLLETTHEAIMDAGLNPNELRGSKTGVFIGVSTSESDEFWSRVVERVNGYSLTGCCRAMFSNRISYSFDFNGPSVSLDTACSSTIYALHHAMLAIRNGDCDAAIVGGANLLLKPTLTLQFQKLSMLASDGKCKAFDVSGVGYVRSETVATMLLQKAKDARRVYATLLSCKTNTDGYKVQGVTYPNGNMQNKLMRELYTSSGINPLDVAYFEAHGTGTKAGDFEEVNSIADLFCKDRKTPLLIGSVKSNVGHSEPASGMCSIIKVLIAMEAGVIPANLHFKVPNPSIPSLNDGRLKVVDKNMPWNGGLVALNSFGFGGANGHVLLRSNPKPKLLPVLDVKLPKLVLVSGRTNEGVASFLDKVKEHEMDDEFISLVHDINASNITGYNVRGFQILGNVDLREIDQCNEEKRPIWYIFSGMGSQWVGMGKELFHVEVFQRSLRRCADALKPEGIDLINLILNGTKETFDSALNSFVSIAAFHVAFVDLLASLDIHPDGILGHSVGELGCAYADGTFTTEQTVLAAYWRGKSIMEAMSSNGAMAVIGLSWKEVTKMCPPDIFPACNNAAESVTVSGPKESIEKFVVKLKEEDIFARMVDSSGIAFHSKYVTPAGPQLRKGLEKIIPNPKQRSSKWISTSIPESAWGTPLAQLSSPAYHVNNLLSPVLFHETLYHIPKNAIVIEIAPHCLLQPILRRSLPPTTANIGLHKKDHSNNVAFLLSNIGKLYVAGAQPNISKLYPPVSYPVGRGTPMIGPLVNWDHSIKWDVANFSEKGEGSGETIVEINLSNESDEFYVGHTIDGRILFPATGYLYLVWKTFANLNGVEFTSMPVVFENLKFQRATIIYKEEPVKFLISIFDGSGEFQICESGAIAVTGIIRQPENIQKEQLNLSAMPVQKDSESFTLANKDVYKELKLRGYEYSGIFQGIRSSNNRGTYGKLAWHNNWVSYMDTMLQMYIISFDKRELYLPVRLQHLSIDPVRHLKMVNEAPKEDGIAIYNYKNINFISAGGVELRGLHVTLTQKRQQSQLPVLSKYVFVPYESSQQLSEDPEKAKLYSMHIFIQIMKDAIRLSNLKLLEIAGGRSPETLLVPVAKEIFDNEINIRNLKIEIATTSSNNYESIVEQLDAKIVAYDEKNIPPNQNLHCIFAANLLSKRSSAALGNLSKALSPNGCVVLEEATESVKDIENILKSTDLIYIGKQTSVKKCYVLLKKKIQNREPIIIQITEKNLSWLEGVKAALKKSESENQEILFVSQGEELLGMVGLMNCIRHESGGLNARYVFIQDKNASKFGTSIPFYTEQLNKQLFSNVLKGGQWGSYRFLHLDNQENNTESLQVEHAYVNTLSRGDLSSLRWIEGPLTYHQSNKASENRLCTVYYSPLNFRDIMLATGKLGIDAIPGDFSNKECVLGLEFSGRNSKGKKVMGMLVSEGMATTVLADQKFLWEVPEKWSLEEAATIPVVYATSYYALFIRGQMKPGERVLIHAGSGGVGQASISIALHAGCEVFTTVGSKEKRDFLKRVFPKLDDRHIGNSRDTSFEQMILSETGGEGVDLVLNSLAEEKLQASIRCLGNNGRFLEIGKFDLSNDSRMGMSVFLKNTSFHGILLDSLMSANDLPEKQMVVDLVNEGIKNGAVRPLSRVIFTEQQLEQAFRYMATGKHIGKVLLKIRDEEPDNVVLPLPKTIAAVPRSYMDPDKYYILVGGLGGFGLELADWLYIRGAQHIVLVSRSGVRTGYQALCVQRWRDKGIDVTISKLDLTTLSATEELIKECNKVRSIGGIFNLAGILMDGLIENLEEKHFKMVALPKINITKNLDAVSRKYCPALDYFVVFSSITSGMGNIGQSNYGFANSAMERIVEQRRANSLPGTAIQWGAIGDVGMVVENFNIDEISEVAGTIPQRMSSCLQAMDVFLQQPHTIMTSVIPVKEAKCKSENKISLLEMVGNILGIKDLKTVNFNSTLSDLGMDSLMGTEIKQTLERGFDLMLSPQEIRNLTFEKLKELSSESATVNETTDVTVTNNSVTDTTDGRGNNLFYQCDGEIVPVGTLVQLKSKSTKSGEPLFLIHAIEGTISSLTSLASELKRPVWGLQCTKDAPLDSLNDLAKFYIKQIKRVQKKGTYHIAGYSFGTCIAFEVALHLERAGENVILNCIDGSPLFIKLHCQSISRHTAETSDGLTQNDFRNALAFFVTQFNVNINFVKAYEILKETTETDEEIINKTIDLIGSTTFSPTDLKTAGLLFYKKLLIGNNYVPSDKFNGPLLLIKATDNFVSMSNDYGLSEICTKSVQVEQLSGNHRTILVGDNVKKLAELLQV